MRNLVGAPIPAALAEKAARTVDSLRAGRIGSGQSDEVVEVICEMTEAVMGHFFVRPGEAFGLGMTLRGVIEFGVSSTVKTMRFGLRKVIPKLRPEQLRQVGDFLDEALYDSSQVRR
ncbi:MAG TPA: hypothetical protein VFV27_08455 [Nevskiaceae bacterium]|nr:hypothetical protein [Nevskiaceae bacterium]